MKRAKQIINTRREKKEDVKERASGKRMKRRGGKIVCVKRTKHRKEITLFFCFMKEEGKRFEGRRSRKGENWI